MNSKICTITTKRAVRWDSKTTKLLYAIFQSYPTSKDGSGKEALREFKERHTELVEIKTKICD